MEKGSDDDFPESLESGSLQFYIINLLVAVSNNISAEDIEPKSDWHLRDVYYITTADKWKRFPVSQSRPGNWSNMGIIFEEHISSKIIICSRYRYVTMDSVFL